jgi:hypothetical protein
MKKKTVIGFLVVALIFAIGLAGCQKCEEQYKLGFAEGQEAGYNEGYNEGYQEGTADLEAEVEAAYQEGYQACQSEKEPEEENGEEPEENGEDVNLALTLEILQNSKVVRGIAEPPTPPEGVPVAEQYFITMRGEISEISGRVLTLTNEGDSLSIYIDEDILILAHSPGETVIKDEVTYNDVKEINFEELETGDAVQIVAEWSSELRPDNPFKVLFVTLVP